MGVHRAHHQRDQQAGREAQHREREERHVPVPVVREVDADRDAEDLARGERGLDEAHHAAAHLRREEVGGDREHDGADDAAEETRDHARDEQRLEAARETAPRGARDEAGVEEQQQLLAIEAVGEAGGEEARDARGEGVGRHDGAELRGRDVERGHDQRAERRHQHEVDDHGELQEGEHRDDALLVAGELQRRGRSGGCGGHRDLAGGQGEAAQSTAAPDGPASPGRGIHGRFARAYIQSRFTRSDLSDRYVITKPALDQALSNDFDSELRSRISASPRRQPSDRGRSCVQNTAWQRSRRACCRR